MAAPTTGNTVFQANSAAELDPEREFEAAFAPVIEMPAAVQASTQAVEVPVMEPEPMPPVAFLEEPAAFEAVPERYPVASVTISQAARSADPMPYLAQLTPFGSRRVEETPQISAFKEETKEPSQIQVRGKKALQDGAKIAAQSWAGALALASSTTASVRNHFEEYKKRAQVRSAEAQAQHAARLLDLEQRRAEAHERASELEMAREQAAARLMELVRLREPGLSPERLRESMPFEPGAPARQPSPGIYERVPVKVAPIPAAAREPRAKPASTRVNPIDLWRGINPPLRAVLSGAAAVTALFIMGIALGLFHSKPPQARSANQAANGVTVQSGGTGGVTVQAGGGKQAQPGGTAQAKPQPGQASVPAQTAASSSTPAKPSPRVNHLVAQQSEKQIGDDVVIRHFSRPVPTQKPKQSGQQAGLKHFSDLDN
jgi:hypothetical protein